MGNALRSVRVLALLAALVAGATAATVHADPPADAPVEPVTQQSSDISAGVGGTGGWSDGITLGGGSLGMTAFFGRDGRPVLRSLYGMHQLQIDFGSFGFTAGSQGHWGIRLLNRDRDDGAHFHLGIEPTLTLRAGTDQGPGSSGEDNRAALDLMGSAGIEIVGDSCVALLLARAGGFTAVSDAQPGGEFDAGPAYGGGAYLNCSGINLGGEWTRNHAADGVTGTDRPTDRGTLILGIPVGDAGVISFSADAIWAHEGDWNGRPEDLGNVPSWSVDARGWIRFERAF
ncbi:MAG: hypothetical protein IT285_09330 [Bdellovibrionales bacterium]|nr:hypothetical protein [Bdellovibrionales bacterium]